MSSWYHSSDGWFWERLDDGSVRVTQRRGAVPDGEVLAEHVMTASVWASLVSSVSRDGETGERWQAALSFHGASK